MQLHPKRQPGRADRKAAAYASEIVRLRRAGYTYEAIREAIAQVGIDLSTSALRREVRRLGGAFNGIPAESRPELRSAAANTPSTVSAHSPPAQIPAAAHASHGREIAEAFFTAHPSNPLVRNKESP